MITTIAWKQYRHTLLREWWNSQITMTKSEDKATTFTLIDFQCIFFEQGKAFSHLDKILPMSSMGNFRFSQLNPKSFLASQIYNNAINTHPSKLWLQLMPQICIHHKIRISQIWANMLHTFRQQFTIVFCNYCHLVKNEKANVDK